MILATLDSKSIGIPLPSDTLKRKDQLFQNWYDCSRLVMPLVQLFKAPNIVETDEYRIAIDILYLIYPNVPKKLVSRSIHQLFKYTINLDQDEDQVFNLTDLKKVIRFSRDVIPVYLSHFLKYIYVKLDIDKDQDIDDEYEEDEEEEEEVVEDEGQLEITNNLLLLNEIVKVVSLSNIYPYAFCWPNLLPNTKTAGHHH
ncbi:hypothetical protein DFA_04725 [Cavenderia fasciculata]|uniref:Uncharacterized protein n=1 Tax=Cavenderia fasciculata TaxID=261658 RepID=F4PQD2_CACFS|nr:uncharacterized protein DFA_04725 [Cavenderia fasciculata]EGG22595.1 hypothetical protein DFA_04725 [Cavenderia fasciculata]|eukprot:XP_004360446.1 hypothetical protein DFA_04725 [Cavenderia fasciculata]